MRKTRRSIDYGKYYILTIKDNVLENQDGQFLPEFTIHFTTDANSRKQSGIKCHKA